MANRFGFGENLGRDVLQGIGLGLGALTGEGPTLDKLETNQILGRLNAPQDPRQPFSQGQTGLGSQDFARLAQIDPNQASVFEGVVGARGEEAQKRDKALAQDAQTAYNLLSTNPDKAVQLLENRANLLDQQRIDSSDTREVLDLIKSGDLEGANELLTFAVDAGIKGGLIQGPEMISIKDGQVFMMGVDGKVSAKPIEGFTGKKAKGSNIGNVSPKDFTVESLSSYEKSGNIGDLVRFRPKVKDIAGVPHQFNAQSSLWEPLVDMRSQGLSEQVAANAELEAKKQSKLDFTKQQSKFQGSESQTISKIDSMKSKNKILVNTAQKIKDVRSGWSTQYGASLAALPASEARKMKGLIDTIKANSAFGTITDLKASGGTLGAISAPELVLLEAALGTLDQFGDNEEQQRVIDQIIDANRGAMNRVDNAYLMDRKKFGSSFEEATTELSDEDILKKYQ